jgi:hypothetical protein
MTARGPSLKETVAKVMKTEAYRKAPDGDPETKGTRALSAFMAASRYFATVPVSMAARVPLVSGSPSGAFVGRAQRLRPLPGTRRPSRQGPLPQGDRGEGHEDRPSDMDTSRRSVPL